MSNEAPALPCPIIRAATAADDLAVHAIVDAAYRSYIPRIGKPPGPMLDDYAKRIADGQVWILNNASNIVGILVLQEMPDGVLLDNIAVAPDQQGKGHGRMLLDFAEAEAKRRGWNEIRLYTNALMTENIALYRRIGYVETMRVTEKGFDRVYMTKRLVTP
ncbi:MAG: GNAT family N-acetyltransferase [Acetobacteraceae bacterium]|jgi:ribosomal protein S18 acetylase RimI-like enzyme